MYPKLTTLWQRIEKSVPNHFWKLLTNFGDHLFRETICLGDHMSMETKWVCLGTVCSWGPIVGNKMSGDWMCLGPNENQPSNTNFENTFSETISTNVYKCDTGLDTFWALVCMNKGVVFHVKYYLLDLPTWGHHLIWS